MSMPTEVEQVEPVEKSGFRDLDPDGVLEQPFWERYNTRLEMPISTAFAVLLVALAVLFYVLAMRSGRNDKTPVPINFLGGDDDEGEGSPGSGGSQDLAVGQPLTAAEINKLATEAQLKDVKDEIREKFEFGDVEIPDNESVALSQLNEDLRKKLLGAKSGNGSGTTGGNPEGGNGPGGFGASSTYARALRWVLKFDTTSGQDYVNQISGIGGAVMIPVPPDNKQLMLFKDPKNGQSSVATDAEMDHYFKLIQFSEVKPETVQAVADALKLSFKTRSIMVYFPRDLEEKLSTLEKNYQNKPPEKIRKTVYKVIVRGGKYDFIVSEQQLR